MRAEWLRREGASELIVVLTGWAAGAAPFRKRRSKVRVSRIEPRI